IVAVELGDRAFEWQFATSGLELLHEISGASKQHAPSTLDQSEPERCRQMALAAARRAEQQDVGTLLQPGIAGRQRHHLRLRDHWHGLEVESGERLAGGQPRLDEMPLEAAAATIDDVAALALRYRSATPERHHRSCAEGALE